MDQTEPQFVLCNAQEVSVDDAGWALLAPYGDSQYQMRDQSGKLITVIQRITKESAVNMANAFNGFVGKVKRFFKGGPIYFGHPDHAEFANKYPDKELRGMFRELEARDDGLYVRPIFNTKGEELLMSNAKYYFSGVWPVQKTGEKDGLMVLEPYNVKSIGLVRTPNLPTELLNEKLDIMDRTKLIALLAKVGITLANESTDEQIEAGLTEYNTRQTNLANESKTIAETAAQIQLKAKDVEISAAVQKAKDLETTLANERALFITSTLTARLKAGAITEAEKGLWQKRLEVNFANELPVLEAIESKLKTTPNASVDGSRRTLPGRESAAEKIRTLANERTAVAMAQDPHANRSVIYAESYASVCKENPALIEEANKPN